MMIKSDCENIELTNRRMTKQKAPNQTLPKNESNDN